MSFLAHIRGLDPAPRRFLFFTAFNVVSWQCIVGQVLVLFGRHVDMPPSWVGFLLAFLPLSMIIILGTVPLVVWWGPKRLMLSAWFSRNVVACAVFTMPWTIYVWGPKAAWYVLLFTTLAFCLARALGAAGWLPWLHEVVPERQRGPYFSAEVAVAQTINVGVTLVQAFILLGNPGLTQFLIVYAIGIAAGFISLLWMGRVPGGKGSRELISIAEGFASYKGALANKSFVRFVIVASLCFVAVTWASAAYVLFLRDAMKLSSHTIMFILAAGSFGILLSIRHWAHFAELNGSGLTMFLSLIGYALASFFCIELIPDMAWAPYAAGALYVAISVFNAAFWMAVHRAMLNFVPETDRVSYTNLWTVGTSLALAATPVAVGYIVEWFGIWGFRSCFLLSTLMCLVCAVLSRAAVQDGQPFDRSIGPMLDPVQPFRTVGRILWITLGLHSSNPNRRKRSVTAPAKTGTTGN
ncbi:MAG: hypothetical protein AMXMBFR84_34960 [Candidatus Hydrogenedentota bacterium]